MKPAIVYRPALPPSLDQLHLQGKRQQGKMEVWMRGWGGRPGRPNRTKGVRGQNNSKALWWNWSETACLQRRRHPSPRRNLQRHTGKGLLQSCWKHTHTDTDKWGTIEASSWPNPGQDSAGTPGTHHTQSSKNRPFCQRLLRVRTCCRRFSVSAYTAITAPRRRGAGVRPDRTAFCHLSQNQVTAQAAWPSSSEITLISRQTLLPLLLSHVCTKDRKLLINQLSGLFFILWMCWEI